MAKTATKSTKKKSASKPVASSRGGRQSGSGNRSRPKAAGNTAADALLKLLQSPLVADLLAVGATAAVAALTEHRYSSRSGAGSGAKRALKGAVTAAAAAMGRRIATEFDEIKKSAKAKSAAA
ncbi:MAG: hypothetical protein M3428_00705 [Pseudomonadota bacterium]|nr:hypothetical protein [Pseudomonadota bacterium]